MKMVSQVNSDSLQSILTHISYFMYRIRPDSLQIDVQKKTRDRPAYKWNLVDSSRFLCNWSFCLCPLLIAHIWCKFVCFRYFLLDWKRYNFISFHSRENEADPFLYLCRFQANIIFTFECNISLLWNVLYPFLYHIFDGKMAVNDT